MCRPRYIGFETIRSQFLGAQAYLWPPSSHSIDYSSPLRQLPSAPSESSNHPTASARSLISSPSFFSLTTTTSSFLSHLISGAVVLCFHSHTKFRHFRQGKRCCICLVVVMYLSLLGEVVSTVTT